MKAEREGEPPGAAHRRRLRFGDDLRVRSKLVDTGADPPQEDSVAAGRPGRRLECPQSSQHLPIGWRDDLERDHLGTIKRNTVGDVEIGKPSLHLGRDPSLRCRADPIGGCTWRGRAGNARGVGQRPLAATAADHGPREHRGAPGEEGDTVPASPLCASPRRGQPPQSVRPSSSASWFASANASLPPPWASCPGSASSESIPCWSAVSNSSTLSSSPSGAGSAAI